jgi:ABC-2 type transport system permease protein
MSARTRARTWLRQVLAIGAVNLRRLLADRVAIGYLLMLPLLVVLLVGAASESASRQQVGVTVRTETSATQALVTALRASPELAIHTYGTDDALRRAVRLGDVAAGLEISVDSAGARRLTFVADQSQPYPTTSRLAVESVLGSVAAAPQSVHAVFAASTGTTDAGYDHASRGNLLLFVFLSTVSGAGGVAATRRLGIGRRMMVAPLSSVQIVLGELIGRFVIGAIQAVFVLAATTMVFGTSWGLAPVVAITVLLFAALSAAVSVALGATVRSETQGLTFGIVLGLVAGMLGGSFWSLDDVGSVLSVVGGLFPHAWAMTSLDAAVRGDVSLSALTSLAAGTAAAVLVAARQMRRPPRPSIGLL